MIICIIIYNKKAKANLFMIFKKIRGFLKFKIKNGKVLLKIERE